MLSHVDSSYMHIDALDDYRRSGYLVYTPGCVIITAMQ